MVTFKEYYQGDKMMTPMATTGKNPFFGMDRKHQNIKKKEFKHICPHVNNLINGRAHQVLLMGQPLFNTLSMYSVDYAPGQSKGLGNSGVEVKMYEDEEGNQCGMLTKKDNGL
jgi:hypothetical protein